MVGGVSLFGGRGAILGMVLGAALLDIVDNLLVLINAPETVFKGFLGAIVIVAVVLNTFIGRRAAHDVSPMTVDATTRAASAIVRRARWTRLRLHPAGPVAIMFFGLLAGCIIAGLLFPARLRLHSARPT